MGTINNTNTMFTLPNTPITLKLFYSGLLLTPLIDYTLGTNTITYNFAPSIGSTNLAYYTY